MKARIAGVSLVLVALAYAVNVYAFTTASVNAGASVTITATDQLLAVSVPGTTDNPAGMGTTAPNGKLTVDFGSNGSASKGIQADATYTYDNVIRIKNNNASTKNIDMALTAAAPAGVTVELSLAAYNSGTSTCGAVSYGGDPAAVATAAGAEVCASVKITTSAAATAGAKAIDLTVSAS